MVSGPVTGVGDLDVLKIMSFQKVMGIRARVPPEHVI